MRSRAIRGLGLALALCVPLLGAPHASAQLPQASSPLVGSFCSTGAPITGRGATFANNAHQLVFIPSFSAACGAGSVTYFSEGSGSGKRATINHTDAFGMSDEPLTNEQLIQGTLDVGSSTTNPTPRGRVSPLHTIPMALGAVTVSYNLGSCGIGQEGLSLTSEQVGSLFTGLITDWGSPLLMVNNPQLGPCAGKAVRLAVRSDGSGTTYAFKDFLSKRNPIFQIYKQDVDVESGLFNTRWPAEDTGLNIPLRGNGNGGVAGVVAATDGAVGYVELSTAQRNGLTWALVDGPHRVAVSPANGSAANCDLAALGATHPPLTASPGWDAVSITDSPNPLAYPICSFTYGFVYNNLATAFGGALSQSQAQTLVDYFAVALRDDTQAALNTVGYGALPVSLRAIALAGLATVAYA